MVHLATTNGLPAGVYSIVYTRRLVYLPPVAHMSSTTTVKVSKTTLTQLERLREQLKARSLDDAIKSLIKRHRLQLLQETLGADRGKIRAFTEEDRGEDR